MATLTTQIPRDQAQQHGQEAVRIIQAGGYQTPGGRRNRVYRADEILKILEST